ncbi:hypothetical protein ANCDUO_18783 [Ancylostoma duodenale]|uniref:Uncharacterized protein n=1 Tax=Ancylostoma duodenale TaxID=51022 RepID=A0A0C2C4B3_9BILA|nr:hypothetical protein ANCDUO_18783 [Ancylostoma duodenale]
MPRRSSRINNTTAEPSQVSQASCNGAAQPVPLSAPPDDLDNMSSSDLLQATIAQNSDPIVDIMLRKLVGKLARETAEKIEEEKRARSVVISGLAEAPPGSLPSDCQKDLETKVEKILDVLQIECRPAELRRMGRPDPSRPRLVKLVFPTRREWSTALANARLLRSSGFADVYIRRSMTESERKKDYELRQAARERNRSLGRREWVVYRGDLRRVSEINAKTTSGNPL